MDDTRFATVFALTCVIMATVIGYGSYRLGAITERKALTSGLIQAIEASYYDGHGDAERDCRMGLIK